MIGNIIDERYRIESEAAVGGMAEVYRAYDLIEERPVAIKLIKKEYCEDQQYIRRFEREARAVMSLESPNIVRAYGCGVYEGRGYIALEYVEGKTLKEMLRTEGRLSPKEAVYITGKVLDALECAHEAGYVHRDVKPQNVLISENGDVKLADFGIAKAAQSATKTFESKALGTVQYVSPEQASNLPVNEKSDLYSVGIMLYEMLIGEPPFDGDDNIQIVMKHINDPMTPPREIDPTIPKALSDVCLKAAAKNRDVRYACAADMKRDLERALEHPNSRFARVNPSRRVRFNKDSETGDDAGKGLKLWHILVPVGALMLVIALIFGLSRLWGDPSKSGYSKVPNVLDKSLASAERTLKNRELTIRFAGNVADSEYEPGRVCRQSPPAGTSLKKGSVVDVWISSGTTTAHMVGLTGKRLDEAAPMLRDLGVEIEWIDYEEHSSFAEGTIVGQTLPEGTEIVPGDQSIGLTISGSLTSTRLPMPDLSSANGLKDIDSILRAYGITDKLFRFSERTKGGSGAGGFVEMQSPAAGEPIIPPTTHADVYLYSDFARGASADIEFELESESDAVVMVTVETGYGEFVIHEERIAGSDKPHKMKFTAGYLLPGEYKLKVYVDSAAVDTFVAKFI